MADIIAAHWVYDRGTFKEGETYWNCRCGELQYVKTGPTGIDADHAAHVAEELAKAGYGNVQEAKAKALTEAADELARLPYAAPGAPGRAEYERGLAVRRGESDRWLRARATILTAEADPEGRALVQAIHNRKAMGTPDHTMWCRGDKHDGPCKRGRSSGTEA